MGIIDNLRARHERATEALAIDEHASVHYGEPQSGIAYRIAQARAYATEFWKAEPERPGGEYASPEDREAALRALIDRYEDTIRRAGERGAPEAGRRFADELAAHGSPLAPAIAQYHEAAEDFRREQRSIAPEDGRAAWKLNEFSERNGVDLSGHYANAVPLWRGEWQEVDDGVRSRPAVYRTLDGSGYLAGRQEAMHDDGLTIRVTTTYSPEPFASKAEAQEAARGMRYEGLDYAEPARLRGYEAPPEYVNEDAARVLAGAREFRSAQEINPENRSLPQAWDRENVRDIKEAFDKFSSRSYDWQTVRDSVPPEMAGEVSRSRYDPRHEENSFAVITDYAQVVAVDRENMALVGTSRVWAYEGVSSDRSYEVMPAAAAEKMLAEYRRDDWKFREGVAPFAPERGASYEGVIEYADKFAATQKTAEGYVEHRRSHLLEHPQAVAVAENVAVHYRYGSIGVVDPAPGLGDRMAGIEHQASRAVPEHGRQEPAREHGRDRGDYGMGS